MEDLFTASLICLIIAIFSFFAIVAICIEIKRTLKILKDALKTIKHYEILVHGDDRFIIPLYELKKRDKEIGH